MASTLTLESKLKLPSGYEIPVLGYGASPRPPPLPPLLYYYIANS